MPSLKRHEGYLLIDHRDSPGVSEEFVKASGKPAPIAPGGKITEMGTYTCCHCQAIVFMSPRKSWEDRHHCRRCDRYTCLNPACVKECRPFKKTLDINQERAFKFMGKEDDPLAHQVILTDAY